MPVNGCETIAYPTIGIILLGGVSDPEKRYPLHCSAGIAYTSPESTIFAKTRLYFSEKSEGVVNGSAVSPDTPRSPIKMLQRYRERYAPEGKPLSFESENYGILSGSSDAGAAAMATAVKRMYSIDDEAALENDFRSISESVGRSLHGGLTATTVTGKEPKTERLLPREAFNGYTIIACQFGKARYPSDSIHSNAVRSDRYGERISSTERKCEILRSLSSKGDVEGIFDLAQEDTKEYHSLNESVGVKVITEEMKALIIEIERASEQVWCRYIVTGGSNVFVAVRSQDSEFIEKIADASKVPNNRLVLAPEARVVAEF